MKRFIALCLFCLATGSQGFAQAPLTANFVAPRIPLHLELDKTGFLIDVHQWLMARAGVTAELAVLPSVRALAIFEAGKADGLYPSWVSAKYAANVVYTAPFMQVDHFIFSRAGTLPFTSLEALKGRKLGLVQHYELELDFAAQDGLFISYARNSQALITLLLSGRVDAIILSDIEVSALQNAMKLQPLSVDPSKVLLTQYLGYVLQSNAKGAVILARINDAITEAQATGVLQDYLQSAVGRFK